MIGILLCATCLAGAPADKPLSYAEAHQQALRERRPMLILVGAEWCPACHVMKHTTLPTMQQQGKLKSVIFAQVNLDTESELAEQLMRNTTIPQLVLYTPAPQGWYRMYLHGAQAEERIEAMIARGLDLQHRAQALASKPQTERSETPASAADE